MQIRDVNEIQGHIVDTDDKPWGQYIRYGYDCWYLSMGESDEPVYNCEELEKTFQEYTTRWGR